SCWPPQLNTFSFTARILAYFIPDRRLIVALLLLNGVAACVGLAAVWPLAILVDTVLTPQQLPVGPEWLFAQGQLDRRWLIAGLAIMLLVIRLMQEILNALRGMASVQAGHNGLMRLRCELFNQLQELSLRYHRSRPQGDTLFRLTKDAEGLPQVLNTLLDVAVAAATLLV